MKARKTPKVFFEYPVMKHGVCVSLLKLVQYYCKLPDGKNARPHIEFLTAESRRGMGYMSEALPKYLKKCKRHGYNQLIAVVEPENVISIHLLEKNGFVPIAVVGDYQTFLIDLRMPKTLLQDAVRSVVTM